MGLLSDLLTASVNVLQIHKRIILNLISVAAFRTGLSKCSSGRVLFLDLTFLTRWRATWGPVDTSCKPIICTDNSRTAFHEALLFRQLFPLDFSIYHL